MSDLHRLSPDDARKLLALAGMSLVAKRRNAQPVEMIWIEGTEVTEAALAAASHRILVGKRRALGHQPVDLTNLIEGGRRPYLDLSRRP
jgi:hypothetical protein